MKWSADDYKTQGEYRKLAHWKAPELVYPSSEIEKTTLHALRDIFSPLPPYRRKSDRKVGMEWQAMENDALVSVPVPIPIGSIVFLENTAEKCISPQTKHSGEGMQSAKHWVQRVDTPMNVYRRLTDGYGISLMFGERFHQFIRNSNNWRGVSGMMLDIDVFKDDEHPGAPAPVHSLDELFSRYPLLSKICSFIMPSASSLYDGRPFKARGIILFDSPITDQRVYRAFGDTILAEIDCIPANVTKNSLAVGFGNTHNAHLAWYNSSIDTEWITDTLRDAEQTALTESIKAKAKKIESQAKQQTFKERKRQASLNGEAHSGENISTFIDECDPVSEMLREGLLTCTGGTQYRWYESSHDRSCDILDGTIHIFSNTMGQASPAAENEPVGTHRFYLYYLCGLDMTKESDRPKIREFLFEKGYGDDPAAFAAQMKRAAKAKLQRTDVACRQPTETLDDARAHLEEVTDTFLSTPTEDSLHIFLVKGQTGGGKSQTTIFKARAYNKRTIGLYQHSGLAEQAVVVALQARFQNPLHLLGREHNWDDSEIAYIPVEERTKDLFSRNNCIMADKVKEFTDKRLAPRTYCELKCPFHYEDEGDKKRNICPHLMQYEDLDQRDFISSCTPNLLFDLNMRGYLKSLVSAQPDDPTDEELAMDAMLGTESEVTKPFEFATIDDYILNGLYTDIFFSESEFKNLKSAWKGTPTGDFAKLALQAFKKKKPKKIIKALRNAFEATLEHHKEIAKSLTQHAQNGTVEWANPPIGSKESQRMLSEKIIRFEDNTKRFIPVDFDAYKELVEKEILCVRPQELQTEVVGEPVRTTQHPSMALMSGVELQKLTPVWAEGATPIELLDIFLKSIGNDENAPINRHFRSGEEPIAVLAFSIPPQAPVGIIPQIVMITPTIEPNDTQRAFDGQQNITFSEHTGGRVKWADNVQVYQYQDARLTSASIFEYSTDIDGKRKLQDAPIGLKKTAEKRLRKLNDWAKATDGLTAFISYKEFTEGFAEVVSGFDIVTHLDKVAGLNFDGLKFLVVFGYPKVKHEVIMEQGLKQYASDSEPLPKGDKDLRDENGKKISEYLQLTEEVTSTENGITITERRYKDPRLEKIRHQLSTEKLEQAIGRARLPVWRDTQTIIFTDTIVHGITDHATLFSSAAFKLAKDPSDLPDAMERIKEAEANGDVKSVMETKGISQRQAYTETKEVRDQKTADRDARIIELHNEGKSQRAIEKQMKAEGYQKVSRKAISGVVQNCSHQLIYTNYEVQNVTTPLDADPPCVSGKFEHEKANEAYRLYTKGGLMPEAVAARLGESEQTIFDWLERFAF